MSTDHAGVGNSMHVATATVNTSIFELFMKWSSLKLKGTSYGWSTFSILSWHSYISKRWLPWFSSVSYTWATSPGGDTRTSRLKQSLFVSHWGNVTGLDSALPMYNTSCGVCSISLTPTAAALTHQGSRSFYRDSAPEMSLEPGGSTKLRNNY